MHINRILNHLLFTLLCCFHCIGYQSKKYRIVSQEGVLGGSQNNQPWPVPFFSDNNFGLITTASLAQPVAVVTPQLNPEVTSIPTMPSTTIGRIKNFNISSAPGVTNYTSSVSTATFTDSTMTSYGGNPSSIVSPVIANKAPEPIILLIDPAYMITYSKPPPISRASTIAPSYTTDSTSPSTVPSTIKITTYSTRDSSTSTSTITPSTTAAPSTAITNTHSTNPLTSALSISLLTTASTPSASQSTSTMRQLGLDCSYKPPLTNQLTVVNSGSTMSNFQVEVPAIIKLDINITSNPNYIVSVSPVTQTDADVVEIVSATASRLASSPSTNFNSLNTVNIDLSDPYLNLGWSTPALPSFSTAAPTLQNRISQEKCLEYYNVGKRSARRAQVTVFIIGGQNANQKEYPHMAALGYGAKSDNQWLCGGSLISEYYVVTAAHCLSAKSLGDVQYVRLGTTTLQTETLDSSDYNVIRRIPYPTYGSGRQYDDIALLQMDRPSEFSPYIAPICLYSSTNLAGMQLTAQGWGRTSANGNTAKELKTVDLDYVPNDVCQIAYSVVPKEELPNGIVDASHVCAGTADGSKDTCQGDSGGPLQLQQDGRAYLVGVTSFGIGCGSPGIPGVYTRISNYIPWIEQIVWGK